MTYSEQQEYKANKSHKREKEEVTSEPTRLEKRARTKCELSSFDKIVHDEKNKDQEEIEDTVSKKNRGHKRKKRKRLLHQLL